MISQPTSLDVQANTVLTECFGPLSVPTFGIRRNRTISPGVSDMIYRITVRGSGTVVLEGSNVVNVLGVDNTSNGTFSKEPRSSDDISDWTAIATQTAGSTDGSVDAAIDYAFLRLRVSVPGDGEVTECYVAWD